MKRAAFSLVELSIVLVILGLLVGGILAGQSLIRAAELRAVVHDVNNYKTAIYTFRDKYFGMPGDITNATAFWGSAATNGNGDGKIQWSNGREELRLWNHLGLSGLIAGNYTGVPNGSYVNDLGGNTPAGPLGTSGYIVAHQDYNTYITTIYGMGGKNLLSFAGMVVYNLEGGILPPADAYTLDGKMDDGTADRGALVAGPSQSFTAGQNLCTSGLMSTASGSYLLDQTSNACRLFFVVN